MATRPSLEAIATPEGKLAPYREPPHNVEAEQALLGALLLNNEAFNRVSDFLLPEHFYLPVHGRIYGAIGRLIERGQIANPVTLKHMFEGDEGLSEAGGAQYLARLAGAAVTIINAAHYARTIHDLALRRALIRIGEETVLDAYEASPDGDAVEQIEAVEQKLFRLAEQGLADAGFRSFTESAAAAYDSGERCDMEAAMAKYFASEAALANAEEALRIHGAAGYSKDLPIERYYRDAPLLCIGEGTNELQRIIIARQLLARNPV